MKIYITIIEYNVGFIIYLLIRFRQVLILIDFVVEPYLFKQTTCLHVSESVLNFYVS